MTRSIHEGFLLGSKLVGSQMTWDNPRDDNRCSISVPSGGVAVRPPILRMGIKVSCKKMLHKDFLL